MQALISFSLLFSFIFANSGYFLPKSIEERAQDKSGGSTTRSFDIVVDAFESKDVKLIFQSHNGQNVFQVGDKAVPVELSYSVKCSADSPRWRSRPDSVEHLRNMGRNNAWQIMPSSGVNETPVQAGDTLLFHQNYRTLDGKDLFVCENIKVASRLRII